MPKSSRILITGGAGFVGSSVVRLLKAKGYTNLTIPRSKNHDLRNSKKCYKLTKSSDIVIHLAANVGGIGYNKKYPATLFYDNLLMGTNMLHEAYRAGVKKFVFIGTVCAYPKYTPVPFDEENLWDGYPEVTNAPYGLAKKMMLVGTQAYRKQYNFNAIYLLPVNIYGPGDNFKQSQSHVIPALIKKVHRAKKRNSPTVTVWGTGKVSREFIYVDDAAKAIVLAMEKYNKSEPINIGSSQEIFIKDLVIKICSILEYKGKLIWDKTKPNGQPRRLLSTIKANEEFGFSATTQFDNGLENTIDWYIKQHEGKI